MDKFIEKFSLEGKKAIVTGGAKRSMQWNGTSVA